MPTYEYKCTSCQHSEEVFARMSDPAPERCEKCGEATLEKVLFPVSIQFKGSGFYNTDYGTRRGGKSGLSDAPSSSSSEGSSSSSSSDSSSSSSDSSSSSSSSSTSESSSSGSKDTSSGSSSSS